ncbi:hypothetical protein Q8W71_29430 [Methylobacterium sp. NEAU 140]|uniref:Flp family type IVb pilin n=1 Tax=Methylobacterium sp. NEAU 140 TaxID=3064945 RepID=UPI0027325432|nr:hypothetical protein [Methylobacterium sp. NEAU 140]MDP4026733.1 hypothetical protein [Methylobacterium sp. NEAU 140]
MSESRRAVPESAGSHGVDAPAPCRFRLGRRFARDARGGTAVEYAMIGALIFAVAAGSIRLYGTKVNGVYGQLGNAMAQIN